MRRWTGHHALHELQRLFHARAASRARPLAQADYICPVDGRISQFGIIDKDQIPGQGPQLQHHGPGRRRCGPGGQFEHGSFANLYLSPRDYHRIHMPCDGRLTRMIYCAVNCFPSTRRRARHSRPVRPQRARRLHVRHGQRPLRHDPGRRHHRRQHGHRLAGVVTRPARARCATGAMRTTMSC